MLQDGKEESFPKSTATNEEKEKRKKEKKGAGGFAF